MFTKNNIYKQFPIILLLLIFSVVAVACTPSDDEPVAGNSTNADTPTIEVTNPPDSSDMDDNLLPTIDLVGTDWDLISLAGADVISHITLQFDEETMGGSDGCNGFGASYTLENDTITIDTSGFTSTTMACEPDIMAQANDYTKALQTAGMVTLVDNTLTIHTEAGDLVYQRPQSVELEGNHWVLQGIANNDAVVFMAIDENTWIEFNDGQVTGSGGCNTFNGSYTLEGNNLSFGMMMSTAMMCEEEISNRESELLTALETVASYEINRQTVTFLNEEGNMVMQWGITHLEDRPTTAQDLRNTSWQLIQIETATDTYLPIADVAITLEFTEDQLTGFAGCNNYFAGITWENNQPQLDAIGATKKMCMEPAMRTEQALLNALSTATAFTGYGDELSIDFPEGVVILARKTTNEQTLFVGAEQKECVGVAPQQCLLVKENIEDEWTFFYDRIEGFDWEAGYEYQLLVAVTERENPPADASSLIYELIEVVSKTPVTN